MDTNKAQDKKELAIFLHINSHLSMQNRDNKEKTNFIFTKDGFK